MNGKEALFAARHRRNRGLCQAKRRQTSDFRRIAMKIELARRNAVLGPQKMDLRPTICRPKHMWIQEHAYTNDLIIVRPGEGVVKYSCVDWDNTPEIKEGWQDVIMICRCMSGYVGLRDDGTVEAAGQITGSGNLGSRLKDWSKIVAIEGNDDLFVGLRADGSVSLAITQEVDNWKTIIEEVGSWRDIAAVSVGKRFVIGLRKDGTVAAAGKNDVGQCDVQEWRGMRAICCGFNFTVGLTRKGRVKVAGDLDYGQGLMEDEWGVEGVEEIEEIGAGDSRVLAVTKKGNPFMHSLYAYELAGS